MQGIVKDRLDFATADGVDIPRQKYRSVVVALYPDVETARDVSQRLIQHGVSPRDISVIVSNRKLRESLEKGISIVPPAEFDGVWREGAIEGALIGGLAGLVFGTEAILLSGGAAFTLPALLGVLLIGVAIGIPLDGAFHEMGMDMEGTRYSVHLHHGGTLLAVYARNDYTADDVEEILRETQPVEIGHHPLAAR